MTAVLRTSRKRLTRAPVRAYAKRGSPLRSSSYVRSCRTVARQERGCVHGAQASRPRVTDNDRLHAIDSVHAHDFGVRHDGKQADVSVRGSVEASAKAL